MPARRAKRPRRKAKQDRAVQTVDALLEGAARVLKRVGYARATTNRIAEAAGVSVGTLYEYFADKDAVFDALIERQIEAVVEAMRDEPRDPRAPLVSTLDRVIRRAMRALPHGPELLRALEHVPDSAFRRRLAGAREQATVFVRELLEAHRDELRVTDLELAAFLVVSMAEGVGYNASEDQFDDRLASELGTVFRLYLTGDDTPASEPRR